MERKMLQPLSDGVLLHNGSYAERNKTQLTRNISHSSCKLIVVDGRDTRLHPRTQSSCFILALNR